MARRIFYSFHYDNDCWRTQQIRNIGFVEGSKPVSTNDWETIRRGGDSAIENWIADQLDGRSCTVVLVGSETANRKWVRYEIVESWNRGMGVVGIRIHSLKDSDGEQCVAGLNPFAEISVGKTPMSSIAKVYRPKSSLSTEAYAAIRYNISTWVEEAIEIRSNYRSSN
jgi:MTH538 TIR-like domain (DUF1863)